MFDLKHTQHISFSSIAVGCYIMRNVYPQEFIIYNFNMHFNRLSIGNTIIKLIDLTPYVNAEFIAILK